MPRWNNALWIALLAGSAILAWSMPPDSGKGIFDRRCGGCHSLDVDKEGPHLRGVYGRRAASLRDFEYSDALKRAMLRWDDASLERWLTDPEEVAPGTDMAFRLVDQKERQAVIGYLKKLTKAKE